MSFFQLPPFKFRFDTLEGPSHLSNYLARENIFKIFIHDLAYILNPIVY